MWPCVVVSGEPAVRVTTGSSYELCSSDTWNYTQLLQRPKGTHIRTQKSHSFVQIRREDNRPTGHRCANYTTLHTLAPPHVTRPPAKNHACVVGGWTTVHRQTCAVISSGVGWNERRCGDPEPSDLPPVVPVAGHASRLTVTSSSCSLCGPEPAFAGHVRASRQKVQGDRVPAPNVLIVVSERPETLEASVRYRYSSCSAGRTTWKRGGRDKSHSCFYFEGMHLA